MFEITARKYFVVVSGNGEEMGMELVPSVTFQITSEDDLKIFKEKTLDKLNSSFALLTDAMAKDGFVTREMTDEEIKEYLEDEAVRNNIQRVFSEDSDG